MKKKKIVLFVFLIVGVLSLILTYKFKQNNLNKNKPVKEEKLSIMIKEDGATDYTKSSSKDIPKGDYTLNYEKSYCKNNGKIEGYDNTTGTVSFAFIGSDKCYLYFDYKEDTSLYGIVKKKYNNGDEFVKLYNGADYGDTTNYTNNIYYYTGNVENNNVLFANYCWKIVRTTDTGGVKIVYNGTLKDGSCNNTGTDSQIGTSRFNSDTISPVYVGYMYNENKVYTYSGKVIINSTYFGGQKAYGDGATYASNKYTLTNAATLTVSSSNISTLVGKYTCNSSSTTGTCSSLWYIVGYSGTIAYFYKLSGGTTDGTTLANQDYVFGKSFTYNGTYTLTDTVTLNSDTFIANKSNVNTHHYTCLTNGNSCTSIYYVYYISNGTPYYITLTGGKAVSDALNEMLYADDVNKNDSTIKAYIDRWYEEKIKDKYDDKLEDTVFCNDRSISSLNGWNPDGGSTSAYLQFKNSSTSNKSLVCENKKDRFTVSTSNGNGKLTYPIGLLTVPELSLAGYGSSHYFNNGQKVWLGSPNYFDSRNASVREVDSGGWNYNLVDNTMGVRPSVSIKPGTTISSGDGSYTKPFVIN